MTLNLTFAMTYGTGSSDERQKSRGGYSVELVDKISATNSALFRIGYSASVSNKRRKKISEKYFLHAAKRFATITDNFQEWIS